VEVATAPRLASDKMEDTMINKRFLDVIFNLDLIFGTGRQLVVF
jgi:hypothetical protein